MSFALSNDAERRADRWRAITVNANRILDGDETLDVEVATAIAIVRHCSAILLTVPGAGEDAVAPVLRETIAELEARLRMAS